MIDRQRLTDKLACQSHIHNESTNYSTYNFDVQTTIFLGDAEWRRPRQALFTHIPERHQL